MVQLEGCLLKFKLEVNNCQGPPRYGISFPCCPNPYDLFRLSFILGLFMWNQDIKPEINQVLNPRAAGPEGSLIGIPGILA